MVVNNPPESSLGHAQLRKYAQDLARLYRSEREKKQQLHATKQQLVKYADETSRKFYNLLKLKRFF